MNIKGVNLCMYSIWRECVCMEIGSDHICVLPFGRVTVLLANTPPHYTLLHLPNLTAKSVGTKEKFDRRRAVLGRVTYWSLYPCICSVFISINE